MTSRSLNLRLLLLIVLFSRGQSSRSCNGRKVVFGHEGYISDGPDVYKDNSHCEWLIDAKSPNRTIHLSFVSMATECSFDFLFVYDGNSYNSRLIATLSGDSPPKSLTAYSGYMLLYLFSDRNYMRMGFEVRYKISDCPWNCRNHTCINHICHCRAGFSGEDCSVKNCPSDCGEHGTCKFYSQRLQHCHCDPGYIGHACEMQISGLEGQGQWHTVQMEGKKFAPRTSHTSVFADDCIWVFGGFDLNDYLDDLMRYCMSENVWERLENHQENNILNNTWPVARSGHAMDIYGDGFFIFGGILEDGVHSDELWFFNISSLSWTLCATESKVKPDKITGHTLTTAEDYLYVLGGKNEDRIFVSTIFRISAKKPDQWEQVLIKGGNYPPKRLVGHSTVYYKQSRSLIVFGGYTQGNTMFSDRLRDIQAFNIEDSYWAHLYNLAWRKKTIPWRRAFHSAVLMGNYLVIYGGNTHNHTVLENCYTHEMFFYHLGCHVWLNHTYFTGDSTSHGLPSKGRFGHTAVVAYGNVMFVIGGYSGQVLGDLLAYKVPSAIANFECPSNKNNCLAKLPNDTDADHCEKYPIGSKDVCEEDPECFFCSQGRADKSNQTCVHITRNEMCIDADLQNISVRCPGICPALHTCGTCVSQGKGVSTDTKLLPWRTYIQECSWCVKESLCQTHSAPLGTCESPSKTDSGVQGWWGGLSANLTTIQQCQFEDIPAGLHWVKYRHPCNFSFPDEVSIVRKAQGITGYISSKQAETSFIYTSRFLGYIHPLNVSAANGENLTLFLSINNVKALLNLSLNEENSQQETVILMPDDPPKYVTSPAIRKSGLPVFPFTTRGHKYYIELLTEQKRLKHSPHQIQAEISLNWNIIGVSHPSKSYVITYEFLEPYSNGSCNESYNCLSCLSDVLCSWCEVKQECMPRNISEDICQDDDRQHYLITSPVECPACENYVECFTCTSDPLCEWVNDNGYCTRRMRTTEGIIVMDSAKCSPACKERKNCTDCITGKTGCAWCENTQTCLPFSDYVSRYIYGQCYSWVDSSGLDKGCHSCASYSTCGTCLTEYGCGWCSNNHNPRLGLCLDGDFNSMYGKQTCPERLGKIYNLSITEPSSWSYDMCPDVEECALGLHDCHPNATCTNVYQSYKCECNRGFEGDGRMRCDETCYYICLNGKCSGPPDFKCECDLGWTGHSCDVDCGCNNHSTCSTEIGICDSCQHRTTGATCDECVSGAHGNPLDSHGCMACNCNGHGDISLGECDNKTGECFCTGNTQGIYCEHCQEDYYGNPRDGGRCYLRCDHRMYVTNVTEGALGSHRGKGVEQPEHVHCLWVLTVFSDIQHVVTDSEIVPTLALTMEGDMAIECGQDAVHVYSGIPEFIYGPNAEQSESLGEFCGLNPGRDVTVYGTAGTITVFFEGDFLRSLSRGFNATFKAHACPDRCLNNRLCVDGSCVCKEGYIGQNCQLPICPLNCSIKLGQGYCLNGLCVCNPGFSGVGCGSKTESIGYKEMRLQILTDSKLVNSPTEGPTIKKFSTCSEYCSSADVYGPSPRSGHTLTACGEGLMFLYGGYSHQCGILHDMWMFDVSNNIWTCLDPATDQRPSGRYHHAAECIPILKMVLIYGGFEKAVIVVNNMMINTAKPASTLWKFNIESHAWIFEELHSPSMLPALAGHTLTHVGPTNLLLVGGFSSENYFSDKVYECNVSDGVHAWKAHSRGAMSGSIPIGIYGHSAVYDHYTQTIYIYGGYLFRSDQWYVSRELFSLDAKTKKWNMLYPYMHSDWESRVFHTAVHIGDSMVVIGGLTISGSYAKDVLVYRYACNTWHRLKFNDFEQEQVNTAVVGLDAVSLGSVIYLFGGFAGVMIGTLSQLVLPTDICALITDSVVCSNISGCQMCVQTLENGENATVCYDSHRSNSTRPPWCVGPSPEDKRCNLRHYVRRDCQHYTTCSQCLAVHPYFKDLVKDEDPSCVWCANCPMGSCIPYNQQCPTQKPCLMPQDTISAVHQCFEYMCPASDCQKCSELKTCLWTRHFQRSSEIGRYFNPMAIYNWNCITDNMRAATKNFNSTPPDKCNALCHTYETCETCLRSEGSEGGSKKCVWSQALQECMPPAYLPLRCTLGECHFLRLDNLASCPLPCVNHSTCAACIKFPECGWCAYEGMNGQGMCYEGSISGPNTANLSCIEAINKVKPDVLTSHTPPTWTFEECKPENECMNQHHTCNPETEDCIDTLHHFRCECKQGYVSPLPTIKCEPVCHQGCVHGVCVKPDQCHCDFGWVGSNCSVECQCNKHSNCKSVSENNKCLKCENNTMGDKCQFCQIMFVGNPVNGGRCVPCLEFCNNHTEICMTQAEYDLSLEVNFDLHKLARLPNHPSPYYYSMLRQGPKHEDAVCIMCQHNTTGTQCETCTSGHFRKSSQDRKFMPCRECHCNGHSNICNVDTGESCQCRNNTETNCENKDEADCWELQCAQCKEYFLGSPTSGHQCYRQMNVDRDYCFDPETQNNCNHFPKALKMGRTVFFAVQPKYLNVDIRITIDVTMGSADVFISNKKDTFQVFVDNKSWLHNIYLDKTYSSGRAGLARRSIMGNINTGDLDDEAIREKLQLHESGSVRITESVPEYLKLKEGDTEFYKMTQFESLEKADVKARGKGKWNKLKDNGTDDMETQSDEVDNSNSIDDVADDSHDNERKKDKKMSSGSNSYPKKTRKFHHVTNEAKNDEDLHVMFVHNIVEFFENVDDKTLSVNESIVQKYLARHKNLNLTAPKKRNRRGITVTDSKKENKINGVASGIKMGEINAGALNTYITVGQQNSVLVVRDVRFRLVITLPRDQHDLRSSRFYIIVRSRGGNADNVTYGNLYFRQDQPHIDLFVFFSVFFSCFFLFLAVCVMLWKMKQTFDARRSRQMREREMECMASRPFARILVLVEHDEQVYFSLTSGLVRPRSRLGRHQNRNQYYNNNDINAVSILPPPRELGVLPIAIEPTEDGQAAVGTVLFQLPGGATAPSHLCLGSALTTRIISPALTQKSTTLRRRTSASSC